jgi:hypothetical protein
MQVKPLRTRQDREGRSPARDILVLLDGHNLHRQDFEGLALVIGEREDALQLADEEGGREMVSGVHDGALLIYRREHLDLSAISAYDRLLTIQYR